MFVRVAAAAAVVAGAAGATVAAVSGHPAKATPAADAVGAPTAVVTRRDLSNTQVVDATLGFGDDRTVVAPTAGVMTAAPAAGSVVRPGQELYALGATKAILLDGSRPAWRDFAEGMSNGADVRELERNLVTLGYDPARLVAVDDHFTAATRAAVEALQRRLGLPVTGSLDRGSVVFLPGERRVTAVFAQPGAAVPAGAQLLTTASSRQVATITLDTSQRSLVTVGEHVQVVLPDSHETPGTIQSVGATATPGQTDTGEPSSTIDVTVAIHADLHEPDGTPVTVRLTTETHENVLSVPVTALLARSGGRRSLEIVSRDGSTHVISVRTGLYAGGYVEVATLGLREGTRVLVAPSS